MSITKRIILTILVIIIIIINSLKIAKFEVLGYLLSILFLIGIWIPDKK